MPQFSFLTCFCLPLNGTTRTHDEVFVLPSRDRFGDYLTAWYYRQGVFLGQRTFTYGGDLLVTVRLGKTGLLVTKERDHEESHHPASET
jgi:hypothetical protein